MPTPNPPLGVPSTITFSNVPTGTFASAAGGGLPHIDGSMIALIEGNTGGVFSIVGLETLALVHDPDLPPGDRAWEPQSTVNGSGPIQIGSLDGLQVTAGFAVPVSSAT